MPERYLIMSVVHLTADLLDKRHLQDLEYEPEMIGFSFHVLGNKAKLMEPHQRRCILTLDEMQLQPAKRS